MRSRWLNIGQVLFCVFTDRDEVKVHKLAKKERGQYPAILTEQTWSMKDLLYGFRGNFSYMIQRVVPSGQDVLHLARSGSQSHRAIWFILPARGASHIIKTLNAKWNAGLILACDCAELVALCKVVFWKTHIPARTPKWPPPLNFCRGMLQHSY